MLSFAELLRRATQCSAELCCAMQSYTALSYKVLRCAMLCYAVPRCATQRCYAELRSGTQTYAVLRSAMLSYAVLLRRATQCSAEVCCATQSFTTSSYEVLYALLCCSSTATLSYAVLLR